VAGEKGRAEKKVDARREGKEGKVLRGKKKPEFKNLTQAI